MKKAIVTAGTISVRTGRAVKYTQLGTLKRGDEIIVLDDALNQDYVKVIWREGYAYSNNGAHIGWLSGHPAPPAVNAVVKANVINVRRGRGQNYTRLGDFKKGDKITVLDDKLDQNYAKVIWQAGYAYSKKGEYIRFADSAETPAETRKPNAVVTASRISVRKGRSQSYAKLGEFKQGDKIVVLDQKLDETYAHVVWDNTDGYAYSNKGAYIRMIAEPQIPNEPEKPTEPELPAGDNIKRTVAIIASCAGGKYIFGAQGHRITKEFVESRKARYPSYFTNGRYEFLLDIGKRCDASGAWRFPADYAWDCSGLWWYAANKANIYGKQMDTTANTLYHTYCVPVDKSELRMGDCVFYEDSSGKIVHMAIIGENGVVHEAMSGYTGVITGTGVNDRSAPRIVGSGTYKRGAWNRFGRPKIFL